jgi:hypothetical protein
MMRCARSQIVIQMPWAVALGIHEHRGGGGGGGISVAVPAGDQEHRQRLTLQLLPQDRGDLTTDELGVMVALDFSRHAS